MGVTVALPGALSPFAQGRGEVALEGGARTVGEALAALAALHPGVVDRVLDERGELRVHVNLFVDGESVRHLQGLDTAVGEGAVLTVVPAVSGG